MDKRLIVIAFSLLVFGCANVPYGAVVVDNPDSLPSIQSVYASRLSKIAIGMSSQEFKQIFPESYAGGQNQAITAYEVVDVQNFVTPGDITRQNLLWGAGNPNSRSVKRVLWFYFYNDLLVKWGRPQDWPDKPDLVIDKRNR